MEMTLSCFLILSGGYVWLCSSLDPVQRLARIVDPNVARKLFQLPGRQGAPYNYMESCEIDCDIQGELVVTVRELHILRRDKKHRLI
jgi:hypothetical protein